MPAVKVMIVDAGDNPIFLDNASNGIDGDTGAMTDTAAHQILPAAGAGLKNYVTSLIVSNTSATATEVAITGLASGNTIHIPAPPNTGGAIVTFATPLVGAANTALSATCLTDATNTFVSAVGYKAK